MYSRRYTQVRSWGGGLRVVRPPKGCKVKISIEKL